MAVERRRAHRYVVPPERRNVTLLVGRLEFPALLVNESAGGFSLKFDAAMTQRLMDECHLRLGKIVRLRTTGGQYATEVVRHQRRGESTFLGLKRVRDEDVPPEGVSAKHVLDVFTFRRDPGLIGGLARCAVFVLIGAFAVAFLYKPVLGTFTGREPPTFSEVLRDTASNLGVAEKQGPLTKNEQRARARENLDLVMSTCRESVTQTYETVKSLGSAEAADALGLSDVQKREVDRIVDDAANDLAYLFTEMADVPRDHLNRAALIILNSAKKRIRNVLTEEQLARHTNPNGERDR